MIQVYIATSADGYIADPDGGFRWLEAYDGPDYGYSAFYEGIGALVMGWGTYDAIRRIDPWMYPGLPCLVLTHRHPDGRHPGEVEFVDAPVLDVAQMARAEATGKGNVWVVGGGIVIAEFLDAGLIDDMHLFTIPLMLGTGIPMYPPRGGRTDLALVGTEEYSNGVVRTRYRIG